MCRILLLLILTFPVVAEPGPAPRELKLDQYGDPLPYGATQRLGSVRWRHSLGVHFVAFSKDEQSVFSCTDNTLFEWERSTGKLRRTVVKKGAHLLQLSVDQRTLIGIDDGRIQCWDLATNKERSALGEEHHQYKAFALTPNATTVAACWEHEVHVYDTQTGKRRYRLTDLSHQVFALSPDGKLLAYPGDNSNLQLFDLESGKKTHLLPGPSKAGGITFTPDGKRVAATYQDGTLRLWDVQTGAKLFTCPQTTSNFGMACPISADGKIIATMGDKKVILWDTATGEKLRTLTATTRIVAGEFSKDGKTFVAGGYGPLLDFWDVDTGKRLTLLNGHENSVAASAFARDSRTLVSAGHDGTLRYWDVTSGKELAQASGSKVPLTEVLATPDGKAFISVGIDNQIRWWDANGKALRQKPIDQVFSALALSPDGSTLACSSAKGSIRLWDGTTGEERRVFGNHQESIVSLAFGLGGRVLISTEYYNTGIHLWDVASGAPLRTLTYPLKTEASRIPPPIAVSPDGRMLAARVDSSIVRVWELATGKERQVIETDCDYIATLAFTADSQKLAFGEMNGIFRLWSLTEHHEIARFNVGQLSHHLACSPDGQWFALIHSDGTITLWPVPNFTPPKATTQRLADLWTDLATEDASKAFTALSRLQAHPQAVKFLSEQLRPVTAPATKTLTALLADLDDNRFAVRETATRELTKLGELATPALRSALKTKLSAEARQRIEALLTKIDTTTLELSSGVLRNLRAIEVLEHLGTPNARKHLELLATGAPEARLTLEAKEALQRLSRLTPKQ